MSKLNETMQLCVKSDISNNQYEKEENVSNTRLEEKEIKCTKKCENASCDQQLINYDEDSKGNFYRQESYFCVTSSSDEGCVPSAFEDWHYDKKMRCKGKCESYSN